MKKTLFILTVVIIAFLIWFKLTKPNTGGSPINAENLETNQTIVHQQQTSPPVPVLVASPETNILTQEVFNATSATNLEQWKAAIKGLKRLGGFKFTQEWIMEQKNRRTSLPFTLSQDGRTVAYDATFINITAKNETGNLMEVELQTPNMNIDETRELGLQLCNMLGVDSKDFLAWSDKVGNHWLDAPLYATGNKTYGFQILRTFNDEKPWFINFIIPHP